MQVVKSQRTVPKRRQKTVKRDQVTNIPLAQATSLSQHSKAKNMVFSGFEQVAQLVITADTKPGDTVIVRLSPILMGSSRVSNVCRSFQKYRFRSCVLRLQAGLPTTVGGLLVVGYCENPDYELDKNNASRDIFALEGAQSKNLWTNIESRAYFRDKGRWYNIDIDSPEVMNTVQGQFYVCVQSAINVTGKMTIPIRLQYEIEFAGTAYQSETLGQAIDVPDANFESWDLKNPEVFKNVTVNAYSKLKANTVYVYESPWTYDWLSDGGGGDFLVSCVMYVTTPPGSGYPDGWVFGSTVGSIIQGDYLKFPNPATGAIDIAKILVKADRLRPIS